MRRRIAIGLAVSILAINATSVAAFSPSKPAPVSAPSNGTLEQVLNQLDAAAAKFKSAQADFQWDQYQKVVNETDVQKGKVYFQKNEHNTLMSADITEPDKKILLFSDGKIQ